MTTPSNLVSLRITEEEIALLDSRVGLDGARNRSDVIRQAIRSMSETDMNGERRLERLQRFNTVCPYV